MKLRPSSSSSTQKLPSNQRSLSSSPSSAEITSFLPKNFLKNLKNKVSIADFVSFVPLKVLVCSSISILLERSSASIEGKITSSFSWFGSSSDNFSTSTQSPNMPFSSKIKEQSRIRSRKQVYRKREEISLTVFVVVVLRAASSSTHPGTSAVVGCIHFQFQFFIFIVGKEQRFRN